jgi:GWxTD domain-containing protein
MNKKYLSFLFIAFFAVVLPLLSGQTKKSIKDLPERHRKWLTEEVVYIISPKEKDVFLQLETDRERDIFIEAFWKQRDPTPNSPANEYKKEHYQRIAYVNQWFGRESPEPGWRSEMGRIYIILGEPKTIEKFENDTEVYPTVIWFYEGLDKSGLPNAFNVVFFKQDAVGEYRLYTPIKYGPQSLLPHWKGDVRDFQGAYDKLLEVSPTLAEVSISLIPGEAPSLVSLSIASDVMVSSKIPAAGYEGVKDAYAEKLLMYKDRVDVEYTTNYIDNDALLDIIRDKSGVFYVHYLIEPNRLSFEESQGKYQAWLEVNGTVSDSKGTMVHQIENRIPIEFTEDQINQIRNKLFSYQDMFPLVPGTYKFNCLIKNTVAKEFTSMEANIMIPEAPSLQIGTLILANRVNKDAKSKGKNKPFQVGDIQLVPSPRNDFVRSDTLYLFFQIFGLTEDLRQNGRLAYVLSNETGQKLARERALKDYPDAVNITEEFPLADLTPGYYSVTVTLTDRAKKEIRSNRAPFMLSPVPVLPRPWVLSLSQPVPDDPSYINTLGNQYLNKKDLAKAKSLLEDAYRKNPRSVKYALDYGRALFLDKDYPRTIEIALPFLEGESRYDFLEILGQSGQALGRYPEAISYYKEYLTRFGANLNILNSVGECYYQLGDIKEALVAWERSLQLNPKQEELKKRVQQIKEKK